MNKFYITTTIPYVNAAPHVGHAFEFIQADVIARYRRLQGDTVYFLSGADENAIKNVQAAEDAGVPVKEFVEKNSKAFEDLLSKLNVSIDQFIGTTEERHKKGAQALWEATDPKYIYKKIYKGLYCVGCELFYKAEELNEKGECSDHPGKQLEEIEEENYFFKLSEFEPWLKELIESDTLKIIPETRRKEILSFINQGLEDFSISRPIKRSKNWGVSVPGDDSQTIYVWYDALANYITALGYPDEKAELYSTFWEKNKKRVHVLGKGVNRFHTVYWPAMLKAANLPLPTLEFIHGYITADGKKMSKSLGNVIDPFELVDKYGVDAVRYFFLREIPAYDDGDFSYEKFETRYNADLAGGLGNLVARVLTMAKKEGIKELKTINNSELKKTIKNVKEDVDSALKEFKFHEALEAVWSLIHNADRLIEKERPWEKGDSQERVLQELLYTIRVISEMLEPFLPETAEKIQLQLTSQKIEPLFPRLNT